MSNVERVALARASDALPAPFGSGGGRPQEEERQTFIRIPPRLSNGYVHQLQVERSFVLSMFCVCARLPWYEVTNRRGVHYK